MRRAWGIVIVTGLLVVAYGCLRDTSYKCSSNDQCGAGGVCELSVGGYCSIADSSCSSGRKFGAEAGSLAGQCTGGGSGGGSDGGVIDMAMGSGSDARGSGSGSDGGTTTCPSDFVTLSGAPAGRVYKILTAPDTWVGQKTKCSNASSRAWLAYPETTAEIGAMDALAGANPLYWIGVDDLAPATTWVNVKGTNAMFNGTTTLPWAANNPSNNPNKNCVEVGTGAAQWLNDVCTVTLPAICACE